jgi:hypothetical protein
VKLIPCRRRNIDHQIGQVHEYDHRPDEKRRDDRAERYPGNGDRGQRKDREPVTATTIATLLVEEMDAIDLTHRVHGVGLTLRHSSKQGQGV